MKKNLRKCFAGLIAMMIVVSCITPVTFAAYTDANNTPVLFNEDISGWEPSGEIFNGDELATLSNGKIIGNTDSSYTLNSDGSITFYEPITDAAVEEPKTVGANMKLAFNKSIAAADIKSDVIVDFDIKKEAVKALDTDGGLVDAEASTGGQRTISFYYTDEEGTTSSIKAFQMNDLGGLERAVGTNPFYGSASSPVAVDGYYSLRMVLSKDEATLNGSGNTAAGGGSGPFYDFKWLVKIYDKNNDDAVVFTHRYLEESESSGYALFKGITGLSFSTYSSKDYAKTNQYQMTVKNPVVKLDGFEAIADENNKIAVGSKTLDVKFTRNVDGTTADDYITLTDEDGANVVESTATNGDTVTLTIPAVEFGDKYKLNILSGLKNTDTEESVFPASFEYEAVVENQSNVIFEEDFSKWTVEEDAVLSSTDIAEISGGSMAGSGHTYSVDGDALIVQRKVALGTASTNTSMSFAEQKLDGLKSSIIFEADIKASNGDIYDSATETYRQITETDTLAGSSSRGLNIMGTKSDGSAVSRALFSISPKAVFQKPADSANEYNVASIKTPAANTAGYWSLKVELIPGTVTVGSIDYAWTVKVYDKNNENNVVHTMYYTAAELASVKGVGMNIYEDLSARNLNIYSRWTIKNPIAYINGLRLVEPAEKKINIAENILELEFTKDVDDTTAKENILLFDKNKNNVVLDAVTDGNKVTLTLENIIDGETYTLYILGGLKDTNGAVAYTSVTEFVAEYIEPSLVLFEEDFSDWGTTAGVGFDVNSLKNYSDGKISGANSEYFVEDGALVATRPASSGQSAYSTVFNFNKSFTPETAVSDIEIDFDYKKEGNMTATKVDGVTTFTASDVSNGGNRSIMLVGTDSDGGTQQAYLFSIDGKGNLGRIANGSWALSYGQVAPSAGTAVDNWYSLKLVVSSGEYQVGANTYAWMVKVYDKNADNKCLLTYYYTADELAKLSGFGEIKFTDGNSRNAGFLRSVFKNVKAELTSFTSVAPEDTVVDTEAGSLEINFNMDVDDTTLDALTLTDKDGVNVIKDAVADANKVTIFFDELKAGENYTLNIGYGLKSAKGAEVKLASYTYTAMANKPVVDIDFTNANDADYTSADIAGLDSALGLIGSTTASVESGTLKVKAPTTGGAMTEGINISVPETIKSGTVVTEIKLMVEEASTETGDMFRKLSATVGNIGKISSSGNKIERNSSASNADFTTSLGSAAYGSPEFVTETIDGAEYISLKIVASRATESDYWTLAVYDNNDAAAETAKVFTKGGTDEFKSVTVSVYRDEQARKANSNAPITIKSAKIYKAETEDVAFIGAAGANKAYSLTIDSNTVTWNGTIYSRTNDGTKNKMYLAAYDESGVLLGIKTVELGGFDSGTTSIEVSNGTVAKAVLYVWDAGLIPVDMIEA